MHHRFNFFVIFFRLFSDRGKSPQCRLNSLCEARDVAAEKYLFDLWGGGILLDLPLISLFLLLQILLLLSIFSSSSCYSPRPSLLLLLLSLPSFTWNRSRSSVLRSRRLPILAQSTSQERATTNMGNEVVLYWYISSRGTRHSLLFCSNCKISMLDKLMFCEG